MTLRELAFLAVGTALVLALLAAALLATVPS